MKNFRTLLVVFFYTILSHTSFGVTVLLDDSKGLSNNSITQIIQDKKGLLWIGTQSGLNTYDGYTFREIPEFKSVHITCLAYDSLADRIWIGAENGLYYIHLKTMDIVYCTVQSEANTVAEIVVSNGCAYVAFERGAVVKMEQNMLFSLLYSVKKLGTKSSLSKGRMMVYNNRVYLAPTHYNKIIVLDALRKEADKIIDIAEARNMTCFDSLFIISTTFKGMSAIAVSDYKLVENAAIHELNKISNNPDFYYCKNDKLYIAYKGLHLLYMIDMNNQKVKSVGTFENQGVLRVKEITCMYEDNDGVLWIGTNKGLIKLFDHPVLPIKTILSNLFPPASIRQIVGGESGWIYIATYNGIYKYNTQTRALSTLQNQLVNKKDIPNYSRALLYDSTTNYLYAGTESGEYFLFRYNLKTKKFETEFYTRTADAAQINAVYSILKDNTNHIWLATNKGLASYNDKTKKITLHRGNRFYTGTNTLMVLNTSAIKDHFWAGGKENLFFIHTRYGIVKRFNPATLPALPNDDEIIFVSEDPEQNVWVGYKNSGIYCIHKNMRTVTRINKSNGLSSNEVYGVLWQGKDTAWISTVNGLCCYSIKNKSFRNYFTENGLPDNEFNQNSFYKSIDQQFYYGGINGITNFSPQQVSKQNPVTLFASSVSKWDRTTQAFTSIDFNKETRSIIMRPADHLLTFTFGLSDYTNSESNSYFYRVNGLYNDWISLGNQNTLRLEGLPAGTFTVQMMAFNKRGMQSVNTLSYKINIIQVFYKTAWFYILVAFCVTLLVAFYFRWRLYNLQKLQELRTQIASNLHDEVGSLLTSIIISTDSVQYSSDTVDEKRLKLAKIASLSRSATNTMSDVLWSIDSRNDYAGNLTDRMREHAEAILLPLNIELEFDFTETKQEQNIKPDTRQNLYLIFKESINNIAKHSKADLVKVYYKQQGNQFEMIIKNNHPQLGENTSEHQGQGLMNMKMRAKKINAVLSCDIGEDWVCIHIKSK
jgi:ligand-binding sensor domain-containing protein/signal transduction histidine kinase